MKLKAKGKIQAIKVNKPKVADIKKHKSNKITPKISPEVNLGLKLEKLIEKGIKVRKIESEAPNKNDNDTTLTLKSHKTSPSCKSPVASFAGVDNKKNNVINSSKITSVNSKTEEKLVAVEKANVNGSNQAKCTKVKIQVAVVNGKSKKRKRKYGKRFVEVNGEKVRIAKMKKEQQNEASSVDRLKLGKITQAVALLLNNIKNKEKKDKLINEADPVYLQLTVIKKGITPSHTTRFTLPHSILPEDPDICLFVKDENLREPDKTVDHYKELLRENDIKNVKTILTFKQIRTEYKQHEMRRKLCNSHDFFVSDIRISKLIAKHLGKQFINVRKLPVNIDFSRTDIADNFEKAVKKTAMKITQNQDMFSCIIGNTSFPAKHIAENVKAVTDAINNRSFPGGWNNVRLVAVKTFKSAAFPVYLSTVSPNDVEEPVMTPIRPKLAQPVYGELSTANDAIVEVSPDGTVNIVKKKRKRNKKKKQKSLSDVKKNVSMKSEEEVDDDEDDDDNEEEEEKEDESDEDTSDFEISDDEEPAAVKSISYQKTSPVKHNANVQKNVKMSDSEEDSDNDEEDDESDDNIGAKVEKEYLKGMIDEWETESEDNNEGGGEEEEEEDDDDEEEEEGGDVGESEATQFKKSDKFEKRKNPIVGNGKQNVSPKLNKRKLSAENIKNFSPSKKSKPDNVMNVNNQIKNIITKRGKGKFDATLGETWTVKQKQPAIASTSLQDSNKKKKNKKPNKFNKHQRKANIKIKNSKKSRNN